MSTSDSTDDDQTDSTDRVPTFSVEYQAKVTLGSDVSLAETEAVVSVTEALATWGQTRDDTGEMTDQVTTPEPTREFRGVEYDPQRPALGVSLRVHSIPESAPPDVAFNAIRSLLDDLGSQLGVEFGAAREVGVIR